MTDLERKREEEEAEREYLKELRDSAALVAFEVLLKSASDTTDESMPRIAHKAFVAAKAFVAERSKHTF